MLFSSNQNPTPSFPFWVVSLFTRVVVRFERMEEEEKDANKSNFARSSVYALMIYSRRRLDRNLCGCMGGNRPTHAIPSQSAFENVVKTKNKLQLFILHYIFSTPRLGKIYS